MRVMYLKVRNMKRLSNDQRGFTLIELVMAMAVATIIMAAASYGILHTFNLNTRNTNYMTAVREAQNAGYWVTHDTAMAYAGEMLDGSVGVVTSATPTGFPLMLRWLDSDNLSITHSCNYTLENNGGAPWTLWRKLDGDAKTQVAQYISSSNTTCIYNPTARKLTFTVTATVTARKITTGTETRIYEVSPRPGTQ